ncbi:hypothetical protein RHGRI_017001 [Rhododendron griersonianum]|uniref:PB1-like domain-containing protein n=1 Tax=Rhododendron griersonianum TaxID=479676 RepID=A0AAV6JW91_9ERIC|nr:hypothetical protein RHGRI_017001 [Rhododendron griersonianum]
MKAAATKGKPQKAETTKGESWSISQTIKKHAITEQRKNPRPTIRYEGGSVAYVDECDPEKMSLIVVGDMVEKLGYLGMINYYYVMTGKNINNGLRMLLTDSDVMEMIEQLPPSRIVDMYVEPITPIEMMESQTDKGGPSPTPTPTPTPTNTDKGVLTKTNKRCTTDKGCANDKGFTTNKGCANDKGGPTDKGGPSHEVNYEDFLVDDAFFEDGFSDGIDVQDLEAEWAGFDDSKRKQPDLNADLDDDDDDDDGIDYGNDSSDDLHSACSNSDDDGRKDKFHEYRR